jgi:hypothetical protein
MIPNQTIFVQTDEGVDIGSLLPKMWRDFDSVGGLIGAVLPWVMTIAAVLVFLFLLWGGIQYIFSQGNPKESQAAQRRITYAIIGLVILILSFLVIQAVQKWTGIPILEN